MTTSTTSAINTSTDEAEQKPFDWDELMENISNNMVIPVIGNEVYKFMADGMLTGIDDYLAKILAADKKLLGDKELKENEPLTLTKAVSRLAKKAGMSVREVNQMVRDMVEGVDFEFPDLEKFIAIDQLSFYLNTTVYNYILEAAIVKVRKQTPTVINFSLRSRFKDCDNIDKLSEPLIFNVFGSFKSTDPAISEEEMLEFTASFKEKMSDNAINLLDTLKDKSLLFLGCTHPDWLIRFFLRVVSNERLNEWPNRNIFIVNDKSDFREKQFSFLKNYNVETYENNTGEFINELSERWRKLNPERVKPKLIFLSYTQKDKAAVENLKAALSQLSNVNCWYDKDELHSGDNFEFTIVDNIMKADIFIPLISANSLLQENKYVLDEWFKADTISKIRELSGRKDRYLMPVVIDDVDLNNNIVKKFYPQLSIERVPAGLPDEDFIGRVKTNLNLI